MSNVFGSSSGFGTLTGWNLASVTDPTVTKRATIESPTGNETEAHQYDERKNITAIYRAKTNYAQTPPSIPAYIGDVVGGILLTSIALSPVARGFITMTLQGHVHTQEFGTSEFATDGTGLRKVAHGITLAKGFGINVFKYAPGGVGDPVLLVPTGTFESMQSQDLTIECDHDESPDENGNTNQGENYNPRITCNFTMYGTGPLVAPSGFEKLNQNPARNNDGFNIISITCFKALAFTE